MLCALLADTNGIRFAGYTGDIRANVDIITTRGQLVAGIKADCGIVAATGIGK